MAQADVADGIHHQISFVLGTRGNERTRRFDFLAAPEEIASYRAALGDRVPEGIQDLQVYAPNRDPEGMTASGTLGDILGAAGVGKWAEVDADERAEAERIAAAIDAEAARPGRATASRSIEFLWDNGGGDDNAFAQSYRAAADRPGLNSEFEAALDVLLEPFCSQVEVTRDELLHLSGDLADAVEAAADLLDGHAPEAAAALRDALAAVRPAGPGF